MKVRKTTRGQIVMIVILSLFLVASCSYIAYDKLFVENQKSIKKEVHQEEEKEKIEKEDVIRSLSIAEEKLLLSQIDDYNMFFSTSYPIDDIGQLENQKKLLFSYAKMNIFGYKEFMKSDIKKMVDSYFGKESHVVYEDILCDKGDGVLYHYNDATKIFQFEGEHDHEGLESFHSTSFFVDGQVLNEKEYTVGVQTIYDRYCGGGTCGPLLNYYKSAREAKNHQNAIITREEEKDLTKNDYEKVKDQLEKYIFTFYKDEAGNYGLRSVKKANS